MVYPLRPKAQQRRSYCCDPNTSSEQKKEEARECEASRGKQVVRDFKNHRNLESEPDSSCKDR